MTLTMFGPSLQETGQVTEIGTAGQSLKRRGAKEAAEASREQKTPPKAPPAQEEEDNRHRSDGL